MDEKTRAIINHKNKTITFISSIYTVVAFTSYDEWGTVPINMQEFDFHLHLDEKLTLSIYPVTEINNSKEADYGNGKGLPFIEIGTLPKEN